MVLHVTSNATVKHEPTSRFETLMSPYDRKILEFLREILNINKPSNKKKVEVK